MKVMQVNGSMNIGGIETFIMNFYRNMNNTKYDFVFLMHEPGPYDYQEEIEKMGGKFIVISPPKRGSRIKRLIELNDVIKKERPDVIHCHTFFDIANVMPIAKKNGVRIRIAHSHTTKGFSIKGKIFKKPISLIIRRSSNVLLACGDKAGRALYGNKESFKIVPNGIKLENLKYSEATRARMRKKFNINEKDVVIGHVGRFTKVKNHAFLIELIKKINETENNYKLVLVGDGPLLWEIKALVNKNGLGAKVLFLGNRKDVSNIYNIFDIFIFPSLYEGMPMSVIEAQANGLQVIASDTIDKDVKINDNVSFMNLNVSIIDWVEKIKETSIKREKPNKEINKYSIKEVTKTIEELYK